MNNKKNKSKSRGKPNKTTQEENKDNIEIVESESLNTDETRVPEIVTESNIIIESDQLINDVPKKPKRSKGKKKKESLFEDVKTKQENNETKDINDVSENVENITEENIPITPCVRKKKKKVKKQDENSKNNIECHNQTVLKCTDKDFDKEKCMKLETEESVSVSMQILSQNVNVAHKDDAPCKKKKKKKHRHDSEKSDAHDPCTLAFQKLIEPLETPNEADNDNNSKDIQKVKDEEKNVAELMEVPLINPNQVSKEIKSPESTITEKLNIDKKHPPKNISEKLEKATAEKIILSTSQENISLLENSENTTVIKETSPKPKAKIVKPVQKKRRNKSESESVKTLIDHNHDVNTSKNIDIMISNPEEMLQKTNFTGNESQNTVLKEVITVSSIPEVLNSDTKNIQAIEIGQCQSIKQESVHSSELKNMSENKQERETSPKNYDDLGFVEVKTSKGKKKRDKAVKGDAYKTTEIISDDIGKEKDTLNLDMKNKSEIKCEELETQKIIIPDLIEYPRSTSEQYVDSNNNTYIQEITPTDEVKIDIPIYTSTPIIVGSGESPESQIRNNPIIINVTEINPQPSSSKEKILQSEKDQTSEKTDIKSKMIEVNRDMEELRRSIERSLAELTSVEKNDTEVDKEFEELFQSQTAEQPSTDITPNKIFNPESSINISDEKCCIEDVRNSARTHEINKNIELKVTENVKTEYKNFDDNNLSSEANLNVSLVSDHNESKKSTTDAQNVAPVCPARRDKSKNKSKKKGKKDVTTNSNSNTSVMHDTQTTSAEKDSNQKSEKSEQKSEKSEQKSEKSEQKSETTQEKGKQQTQDDEKYTQQSQKDIHFEPIDNFEDALTSSVDDINQTFEIIAKDAAQALDPDPKYQNNPQINIISPAEDSEGEKKQDKNKIEKKQNPVSRPKNLLGYPNIPVSSNKTDFKKEKSKPPNSIQAKVKIKDSVEIEKATNKETLIENKRKLIKDYNGVDSTYRMKENEDLVYKYSFRKVFLQSTCHVCKKDLVHRVPCKFCSLVFYCSQKHKDEDWSQHQSLCFAVCTIAHLKEQKHIYADAQNILGHHYRVLRMQTILSCEKILNRKLMPWEQEAILYPRICNDVKCRQWKQGQLKDCAGCGQISYCIDHPDHLSSSHQRWCNSYALYQRLVKYQLTKGRLEPPLPTKVLNHYQMPEKINDVLGSMYEEKIDMDDIQYAALTQIATAPLTAAYSYQLHSSKMHSTGANGIRKSSTFTIHIIGAELPFEADSLNKWEIFFLHLRSDVQDLRVVMVGPDINSSKLPLDLLAKIKLCENCQTNKRRVLFDFHDNESYHEYYLSDAFVTPDIVCAFNPNIHRSSAYNIETWPSTINSILKQRVPFVLTSYSIEELRRDVGKVREWARVDFNVVSEIKYNPYSSVRPDRNFITDHEIPLLFKNYCFCILCGTL